MLPHAIFVGDIVDLSSFNILLLIPLQHDIADFM